MKTRYKILYGAYLLSAAYGGLKLADKVNFEKFLSGHPALVEMAINVKIYFVMPDIYEALQKD